jgi:hypothetical protein
MWSVPFRFSDYILYPFFFSMHTACTVHHIHFNLIALLSHKYVENLQRTFIRLFYFPEEHLWEALHFLFDTIN